MSTTTVNISFQEDLLNNIDKVAHEESRSRSEFLREAARAYIKRRQHWMNIFATGRQIATDNNLSPEDVAAEITAYRKKKNSQ